MNQYTLDIKATHDFFNSLWKDYITISPSTQEIYNHFSQVESTLENDHVAFRTFKHPKMDLSRFSLHFEKMGYVPKGEYFFKLKKLHAIHFESKLDSTLPKIFVSELLIEELTPSTQKMILDLIDQVPNNFTDSLSFMYSGKPWTVSKKTYDELLKESEYAAWMSAFGFHANHFTLFINKFKKLQSLSDVNSFIEKNGFELNDQGGKIKGTPADLLEQSSTQAKKVVVSFKEGPFEVPGCYYEFAKRYPLPNGELYQGFIEKSADKIFESTDVNKNNLK